MPQKALLVITAFFFVFCLLQLWIIQLERVDKAARLECTLSPDKTKHPQENVQTVDRKHKFVLIHTSSRTGSSFTGEFFSQNPKAYYLFEPLKLLSLIPNSYIEGEYLQGQVAELLLSLFRCDYSQIFRESYKLNPSDDKLRDQWMKKIFEQTLARNKESTTNKNNLTQSFLEQQCRQYDVRVIKTIRCAHFNTLLPLILKHNVYVINLIRDPRAKAISRIEIEAQIASQDLTSYISDPDRFNQLVGITRQECVKLQDTVTFVNRVSSSIHVDDITRLSRVVRYEDIAVAPLELYRKIYSFLEVSASPEVEKWIGESTKGDEGGLFSTKRDSRAAVERWRGKLPFPLVTRMQDISECARVLKVLGYKLTTSEKELKNFNISFVSETNAFKRFKIV